MIAKLRAWWNNLIESAERERATALDEAAKVIAEIKATPEPDVPKVVEKIKAIKIKVLKKKK